MKGPACGRAHCRDRAPPSIIFGEQLSLLLAKVCHFGAHNASGAIDSQLEALGQLRIRPLTSILQAVLESGDLHAARIALALSSRQRGLKRVTHSEASFGVGVVQQPGAPENAPPIGRCDRVPKGAARPRARPSTAGGNPARCATDLCIERQAGRLRQAGHSGLDTFTRP
eukprot:scaffold209798_cov30-Tisochrysis_lutea.AAC.2